MQDRDVVERVDVFLNCFGVGVNKQLHAAFTRHEVAKQVHLLKFPARINVQQRERRLGRVDGFARQMQHHAAVFSDRVKHGGVLCFGYGLANDVNAFLFQLSNWGKAPRVTCCVRQRVANRLEAPSCRFTTARPLRRT